jgi:chromosome partitioning protein
MAKVITMYNNKGGVAKTTTLFNLAAFLSQKGKKILIIDFDSQCNSTELFLSSFPDYTETTFELPGTSIWEAFRKRFSGQVPRIEVGEIALVNSAIYKSLYLLRGDVRFSIADSYFANAWAGSMSYNVHEKNTYNSIYNLLYDLGAYHEFDYIFCDLGPSTNYSTRLVFLSCNGYFIPIIPDRFGNQAIKHLGRILPEWMADHKKRSENFRPYGMESFPGKPIFLGAILQNNAIKTRIEEFDPSRKWESIIENSIRQSLFSFNLPVSEKLKKQSPFVARIEFTFLASIASTYGRAIFDINESWLDEVNEKYIVVDKKLLLEKSKNYKKQIQKLAGALP